MRTSDSAGALRDYKKCYSQIEKETLSIVFGVERFHEYFHGRRFIVISDYKPLNSIFNKPIISYPPPIQKLFLRLQKYYFKLQYSPGKDMLVSNTRVCSSEKMSMSILYYRTYRSVKPF